MKPLKFGMVCYIAAKNRNHLSPAIQWPCCSINGLQANVSYRENGLEDCRVKCPVEELEYAALSRPASVRNTGSATYTQ